jgi:hypothetical protein
MHPNLMETYLEHILQVLISYFQLFFLHELYIYVRSINIICRVLRPTPKSKFCSWNYPYKSSRTILINFGLEGTYLQKGF